MHEQEPNYTLSPDVMETHGNPQGERIGRSAHMTYDHHNAYTSHQHIPTAVSFIFNCLSRSTVLRLMDLITETTRDFRILARASLSYLKSELQSSDVLRFFQRPNLSCYRTCDPQPHSVKLDQAIMAGTLNN